MEKIFYSASYQEHLDNSLKRISLRERIDKLVDETDKINVKYNDMNEVYDNFVFFVGKAFLDNKTSIDNFSGMAEVFGVTVKDIDLDDCRKFNKRFVISIGNIKGSLDIHIDKINELYKELESLQGGKCNE